MSTTRSAASRHVRQRKLNQKQPLRIIREHELEELPGEDAQRHIPQFETGVEKGEEVEYHLQAVINASNAAALGANAKELSYIPTPDAVPAKDVKYDELYPKVFSQPATYIRFSSTVEDCIGNPYCMNEEDAQFLSQLNDGKDVNGQPLKDKSSQCSEDAFEEVMNFFEESTQRLQPFANLDENTAPLTLDVMENAREEDLSAEAQRYLKPVYQYWSGKKSNRPLMPSIKVRVLDTTSDADDADPYVCFRRREVRQTRKTRGRDAQVVEKLKKLRLELEQARQLVQMVKDREELNKQSLEIGRKVFEQRKQLKHVKASKNITGEKGEDEELLVNQKPIPKPKRPDGTQARPTIRLRSTSDRPPPDNDLISLEELHNEAETLVNNTIDARKDQHRKWNQQWQDVTWNPLTPPPDSADDPPKWAPLIAEDTGYPTPPPSLPSRSSQDRDGDLEMTDSKGFEEDAVAGAEPQFTFFVPPPYPVDGFYTDEHSADRSSHPACRIRYGRGGRMHLEARKRRHRGVISCGVVSDSDSDDEMEDYHLVPEAKTFDYRCALNSSTRGQRPSGDQTAMMAAAQQAGGSSQPLNTPQVTVSGAS